MKSWRRLGKGHMGQFSRPKIGKLGRLSRSKESDWTMMMKESLAPLFGRSVSLKNSNTKISSHCTTYCTQNGNLRLYLNTVTRYEVYNYVILEVLK